MLLAAFEFCLNRIKMLVVGVRYVFTADAACFARAQREESLKA
jgi:hypothetical protein